jgi:hypothetical protein
MNHACFVHVCESVADQYVCVYVCMHGVYTCIHTWLVKSHLKSDAQLLANGHSLVVLVQIVEHVDAIDTLLDERVGSALLYVCIYIYIYIYTYVCMIRIY